MFEIIESSIYFDLYLDSLKIKVIILKVNEHVKIYEHTSGVRLDRNHVSLKNYVNFQT